MATEPYKKLNYQWEDYRRSLDSVKEALRQFTYDPRVVAAEPKRRLFYEPTSLETHLFILPLEYKLLPLDALISPNEIPSLPQIPKPPPLVLDKTEYPDWYFRNALPPESARNYGSILAKWSKVLGADPDPAKAREKLGYTSSFYERDIESRQKILADARDIDESINRLKAKLLATYGSTKEKSEAFRNSLNQGNLAAIEQLISIAHDKHPLPTFLRNEFKVAIEPQSQIALIEFRFPDYSGVRLTVGHGEKYPHKPKFATPTKAKKYVKQCLYSLIIRSAYLAAHYSLNNVYKSVVVNVQQDWFDPATGAARNGMVASLQAPVDYLISLDLSRLDPEACFRHLKGIATPSLENISPIRPIFVLNKEDERFVGSREIDGQLEPETNLAAIPWEDFEHLVAQLFEWEFRQKGMEVKVTRASRDRGVDAILFDPDPLRGGKYVLQAKRYTKTVDVSAVRDLYGTLLNEGANRGILITTSSYGPDAYEFVKDKPISLVDGPNLILMLQRHGKKYRIDLEEARRLNIE